MEKMSIKEFGMVMGEMIESSLENVTVETVTIPKNNQQRVGLSIRKIGCNVAPTIYIEELYKKYLADSSLKNLRDEAIRVYNEAMKHPMPVVNEDVLSRKYLAENAFISLVGYEDCNIDYVRDIVGEVVCGNLLAMVRVAVTSPDSNPEEDGIQSFALTQSALEATGLTGTEIIAAAKANTIEKGFDCIEMNEMARMIAEYLPEELRDLAVPVIDVPMYILTNKEKCFGASAMCDYTLLKNIWTNIGDFFILPSSIHEVIVIADCEDIEVKELTELVQSVNAGSVAPEDKLTDSVYRFDGIAVRRVVD